ncbi:hypothetical protein FS837_011407 [Tulasnella sp. UAMH 9824]|nr:hypothetical protein FS837_011407 [Tulasnella sp. UAMH 9824]
MENQNDTTSCFADNPSGATDILASSVSKIISCHEGPENSVGTLKAGTHPDRSEEISAGIHFLPQELLLLIFELYTDIHTAVQDLVTLTLVCKLWQDIVEGTPSLWCRISAAEALLRVRKGLAMAKNVPLEICYPEISAKTDQETFFEEIGDRIGHCRSLVVATSKADPTVTILAATVTPNLKTLHLDGFWGLEWDNGPVTLFRGEQAPLTLKDFRACSIPVVMDRLRLSGLRSLELRDAPIISSEEFLQILRRSPALEHCYIDGLACLADIALPGHVQEPPTLQGAKSPTIQLSHLHSLTLEDLPVSFVRLVLSNIHAPNLQRCYLKCKIDRHDQSPMSDLLTDHISHLIPVLTALTSKATTMNITSFGDNEWMFAVEKFILTVDGLALQPRHLVETREWFFGCLGGHLKALPVSLVFFELDVNSEWFTWVASSPKVSRLELWTVPFSHRQPDRQPHSIISLLAQPLESAPNQWLFPELESIQTNVVHEYGKSKILEMVKARHSFIEAERKERRDNALKPFRQIRLRGGMNKVSEKIAPNAEFLEALQGVAGDAEIWWGEVKWTGNED